MEEGNDSEGKGQEVGVNIEEDVKTQVGEGGIKGGWRQGTRWGGGLVRENDEGWRWCRFGILKEELTKSPSTSKKI